MNKIEFTKSDGSAFPEWKEVLLSDILFERNVLTTISDDKPLLAFTIEEGVIDPNDKKTNKRDFLIKDINTKKFLLTELNDIIYNPANLKFGAIHRNKLGRGVVSPIYAIFYTNQDPVFIEHVVTDPEFIKKSLKYLEGTVVKLMTLKPRDFLKLKVKIPCMEEQHRIAEFLTLFDKRIEKQKELIDSLIVRKNTMLEKLFNQKYRFRKADGTMFEDWKEVQLMSLLSQPVSDGPHESPVFYESGVPFISGEAIQDGRIDFDKSRGFISEEYDKLCCKKYKPQKYDIYMVKSGSIGKTAIYDFDKHFNIWSPLAAIRVNKDNNPYFVLHLLRTNKVQKQLVENQGKGAQANIGMRQIENLLIRRPCVKEQNLIADFMNSLENNIYKEKEKLDSLNLMKKGLLQQLLEK